MFEPANTINRNLREGRLSSYVWLLIGFLSLVVTPDGGDYRLLHPQKLGVNLHAKEVLFVALFCVIL